MNIKVRSRVTNNGTLYLKGCYADELAVLASEGYRVELDGKTMLIFSSDENGRKLTKHNRSYLMHIPIKYKNYYNNNVMITYVYDAKYTFIHMIKIEVI